MTTKEDWALVVYRLDDISEKVDSLINTVKGNGKTGMALEIERLRADVADCNRQIAESNARKAEAVSHTEETRKEIAEIKEGVRNRERERAEFRGKLKGVGIGAAFAGVGGGSGLVFLIQGLFG